MVQEVLRILTIHYVKLVHWSFLCHEKPATFILFREVCVTYLSSNSQVLLFIRTNTGYFDMNTLSQRSRHGSYTLQNP